MTKRCTADERSFWQRPCFPGLGGRCLLAFIIFVVIEGAPSIADIPAPNAPVEAILGEWQIVEMVYKGKQQDVSKGPGGRILLEEGSFSISFRGREYYVKERCTIGEREIDVQTGDQVLKGLFEYKDDTLRIVWRHDFGERPTAFDALGDIRVTLYVLKRADE